MSHDILEFYLDTLQDDNENVNEIGVMAALTAMTLTSAAFDLYKNHLSAAARRCLNFVGPEKSKCVMGYKINAQKSLIANLNKAKNKCKSAKCNLKINKKIKKQQEKIIKTQKQLSKVVSQSYGRG